jgi:hypothetical protein
MRCWSCCSRAQDLTARQSCEGETWSKKEDEGWSTTEHLLLNLILFPAACTCRYMRVDPIVTDESIQRRMKQIEDSPTFQPWTKFTNI